MINEKFDWNDISIVPETISSISSRSEVNHLVNGKLPLFTAPMDMVIDEDNISDFKNQNINIWVPRNIKYDINTSTKYFYSYGLDEIIEIFDNYYPLPRKILIDVANGNMEKLLNISKRIKEKFGNNVELMIGNVANPETYRKYCEIGVDIARIGVGAGSSCFVEDTLIKTKKGLCKISDIKNGDLVLTHTGEYKEVINKISYNTDEELININDNISTKDHKYYVLHKQYLDIVNDDNINEYAIWVEASKLDMENHFLIELS